MGGRGGQPSEGRGGGESGTGGRRGIYVLRAVAVGPLTTRSREDGALDRSPMANRCLPPFSGGGGHSCDARTVRLLARLLGSRKEIDSLPSSLALCWFRFVPRVATFVTRQRFSIVSVWMDGGSGRKRKTCRFTWNLDS